MRQAGGAVGLATRSQVLAVGRGQGATAAVRQLEASLRSSEVFPLRLPTGDQGVMEKADFDALAERARESLEAGPRRGEVWALDLFLREVRMRRGESVPASLLREELLERQRECGTGEGGAGRAAKRQRLVPSAADMESCLCACVASGLALRTGRGDEESLVVTVPGAGLFARSLQEGSRSLEAMLK